MIPVLATAQTLLGEFAGWRLEGSRETLTCTATRTWDNGVSVQVGYEVGETGGHWVIIAHPQWADQVDGRTYPFTLEFTQGMVADLGFLSSETSLGPGFWAFAEDDRVTAYFLTSTAFALKAGDANLIALELSEDTTAAALAFSGCGSAMEEALSTGNLDATSSNPEPEQQPQVAQDLPPDRVIGKFGAWEVHTTYQVRGCLMVQRWDDDYRFIFGEDNMTGDFFLFLVNPAMTDTDDGREFDLELNFGGSSALPLRMTKSTSSLGPTLHARLDSNLVVQELAQNGVFSVHFAGVQLTKRTTGPTLDAIRALFACSERVKTELAHR